MSDYWHAMIQGWRLHRFLGVWLMWSRFVPRIKLNRKQGDVIIWDDEHLGVHIRHE